MNVLLPLGGGLIAGAFCTVRVTHLSLIWKPADRRLDIGCFDEPSDHLNQYIRCTQNNLRKIKVSPRITQAAYIRKYQKYKQSFIGKCCDSREQECKDQKWLKVLKTCRDIREQKRK
jgi:hypothetical protein